VVQFFIALFGLTAMYFAIVGTPLQRKWAPVIGLTAQPFWFAATIPTGQWGMVILSIAYACVYLRGIYIHWYLPPVESVNAWREAVLDELANHCIDAPVGMAPSEILQKILAADRLIFDQVREYEQK
jgi:hypothetical protein